MAPKKAGKGPLHKSPRRTKPGPKTTVGGKKPPTPAVSAPVPFSSAVALAASAIALPRSQPVASRPSTEARSQPATAAIPSLALPLTNPGPRAKAPTHAQQTCWLKKNLLDFNK